MLLSALIMALTMTCSGMALADAGGGTDAPTIPITWTSKDFTVTFNQYYQYGFSSASSN